MIKGQLLVYRYNGLHNAKPGVNRDQFHLQDVNVQDKDDFRHAVMDALDTVPPGKGYVLIKWNDQIYLAEKDVCNPETSYVRHRILWHPLQSQFTI